MSFNFSRRNPDDKNVLYKDTFWIEIMKIISIKIVLPSKSKASKFLRKDPKTRDSLWKQSFSSGEKQESKTRIKNKSRGNLCNCDSLLTTRCVFLTKTNPRTNFWIKTNVTSIPMKFEALLGLLASLHKSRV